MAKKSNFDKPDGTPRKGMEIATGGSAAPPAQAGPAQTDAQGKPNAATWAMAMFGPNSRERILATLQRKNLPRMLKAVDTDGENIPVGGTILAILVDVVASPVSTVKGSLLWLALVNPQEDG